MRKAAAPALCALIIAAASDARPADETPAAAPEDWSAHVQLTGIEQGYPSFHSPYQGPNSLPGNSEFRESVSGTAYLGARLPWQGGEGYFDPEFNQGFGIGRTLGIDGFTNGEAAKAGYDTPKPNVARLFLRQVFGLGGAQETLDPDQNQLGETVDVARVAVTAGKFSASDIFDANQYAHDPRTDFLNDSMWESVAWDYPADAKGYTDGAAVELNEKDWALRGGWFLEPRIQKSAQSRSAISEALWQRRRARDPARNLGRARQASHARLPEPRAAGELRPSRGAGARERHRAQHPAGAPG